MGLIEMKTGPMDEKQTSICTRKYCVMPSCKIYFQFVLEGHTKFKFQFGLKGHSSFLKGKGHSSAEMTWQ